MIRLATIVLIIIWAAAMWYYILRDSWSMWGVGLIFLCLAACLDGFSLHFKSRKALLCLAYLCLFIGLMNRHSPGTTAAQSFLLSRYADILLTLFYILSVLLLVLIPAFSPTVQVSTHCEPRKLREAVVTALVFGPILSFAIAFGVAVFLYLARDTISVRVSAFPFALAFAALFSVLIYVTLRITVKHSGENRKFRLYLIGVLLLGASFEYSVRANWVAFGLTLVAFVFDYSIFELICAAVPARVSRTD